MTKVGCCGWGYFNPNKVIGRKWKDSFQSRLQTYASIFETIEVDSTFYRLPMIETAKRWSEEARAENKKFEFILKAPMRITHELSFNEESLKDVKQFSKIAKVMMCRKLLFQSPASFAYNSENLRNVEEFFKKVEGYERIWEPRGTWLTEGSKELIELCSRRNVTLCTDILRIKPEINQRFYYYHLNGFGKGMMQSYNFSVKELSRVKSLANQENGKDTYIMFNNTYMYENSVKFKELIS